MTATPLSTLHPPPPSSYYTQSITLICCALFKSFVCLASLVLIALLVSSQSLPRVSLLPPPLATPLICFMCGSFECKFCHFHRYDKHNEMAHISLDRDFHSLSYSLVAYGACISYTKRKEKKSSSCATALEL